MECTDGFTGRVLNIQRLSTDDGPGLRTTAFLKGCSLSCRWCHNPESLSAEPQVQWVAAGCIGCRGCLEACPAGALSIGNGGVSIDRAACDACGACIEACPAGAMEILGIVWNAGELSAELMKDASFFGEGGGITMSGGEAALQAEFVADVFRRVREAGIRTALDTCGQAPWDAFEILLPQTDLILYDLKIIDSGAHRAHTGTGNGRILANLNAIGDRAGGAEGPGQIWIRTPVIPGATDSAANIRGIGAFLADRLDGKIERWELCAFNNLCRDKYARLGMDWDYEDVTLMSRSDMIRLAETARSSGVDPNIVHWTGRTRD